MESLPRAFFKDLAGMHIVDELGVYTDSVVNSPANYFALSSLGALFRVINEEYGMSFTRNTIRFQVKALEGTMLIDAKSAKLLELTSNLNDIKSKKNLLSSLNYTNTPMGFRLLRIQTLQPSSDPGTIRMRQEFAKELIHNGGLLSAIQKELRNFPDIERASCVLFRQLVKNHKNIAPLRLTCLFQFAHALSITSKLATQLREFSSPIAKTIVENLRNYELGSLSEMLATTLQDTSIEKQQLAKLHTKLNLVKVNISRLLDISREKYFSLIQEIEQYTESVTSRLAIKTCFKLSHGFSFYCRASDINSEDLPTVFINRVLKNKKIFFTTIDLLKLNKKWKELMECVVEQSDAVLSEIVDKIRQKMRSIYLLAESISLLDLIVSIAAHRNNNCDYCLPEFTDTLALKDAVHPINSLENKPFVRNDVFAYSGCSMQIITGPNMSGKSTYLRMIAYIVVMAQVGYFVPATYASIRVVDKVFTRINNDDEIGSNSSSFLVEMREMSYILEEISPASLVIIDELGRGTATHDGLGLAFAICEKLLLEQAFVFFATHYREISEFLDLYPNALNSSFYFDQADNFSHKLQKGSCSDVQYGILLAERSKIPGTIIATARKVSQEISASIKEQARKSKNTKEATERRLKIQFALRIQHLIRNCVLQTSDLLVHLKKSYDLFFQQLSDL